MHMRFIFLSLLIGTSAQAAREVASPLKDHPGNIFLSGERVVIKAPPGDEKTWELKDTSGKMIAQGAVADSIQLGELPVGYYELRRQGNTHKVTLGVVEKLKSPTPEDSPISIDVAMSWFYNTPEKPAVVNLLNLAGVNWVRDRLNWAEIEPRRGEFAKETRYDESARIQHAAGLHILQVNHISPDWTGAEKASRFAPDLRDVYQFEKHIAQRWKSEVEAFEPWNEADIDMFGGQMGAEIASLQKAAYLGLKAGNPKVIASLAVFAHANRAVLDDFHQNSAEAYFDTTNLHHYIAVDAFPERYALFRNLSGGRPLWTTECSMPVKWSGDKNEQEPDDAALAQQALRVPRTYAPAIYEGSRNVFYFLFGHYVEGQTQYGIVHRDLTPRPAYLALAAAGRLLAGARPLGKLKTDANENVYLFSARPDGEEREVAVAWTRGGQEKVDFQTVPVAAYTHLGATPHMQCTPVMTIGNDALYIVLPVGTHQKLDLILPPAMPKRADVTPSPLVLQAVFPKEKSVLKESAYLVQGETEIPVYLYNFSEKGVTAKLSAKGGKVSVVVPQQVEVGAGERVAIPCKVKNGGDVGAGAIEVRAESPGGNALLSFRITDHVEK